MVNQDGTGKLNFLEFLVGLWNLCSHDMDGIVAFGFSLWDSKNRGKLHYDDFVDFMKFIHGQAYNKAMLAHLCRLLHISDKDIQDKYKVVEIDLSDLVRVSGQLHTLFIPMYDLQVKVQEEFFGPKWWDSVGRSRRRHDVALTLRSLLTLSSEFRALHLAASSMQRTVAVKRPKWDGTRQTALFV